VIAEPSRPTASENLPILSMLPVEAVGADQVLERLLAALAAIAGLAADEVSPDQPLIRLGLDSLRVVELKNQLQQTFGFPLTLDDELEEQTPRQLAAEIAVWLEREGSPPGASAVPGESLPLEIEASSAPAPAPRRIDLLQRTRDFRAASELRDQGLMPYYTELSRNEGGTCRYRGRDLVMMGSNNYLGLTADPRVRKAAAAAALVDGPSMTGSRLLNGTTTQHRTLEEKLAAFLGRPDALIFTTGYQANIGLLSALMAPGSVLMADESCHASIFDGARVSGCEILTFRHNDAADLDRRLGQQAGASVLVIVDGVYSMHGDLAPLAAIRAVCDLHQVTLAVDDAHGLGMLGRSGRGSEEHAGRPGLADVLCGTFSKSLASVGGWVAGEAAVIDWIRFHGRSMLFSAAISPPALAAASAALDILQAESWRLQRLAENARFWRSGLARLGFDTGPSETAIVPVVLGDDLQCMQAAKLLLEAGVYVNCAVYPAVPRNNALLRTSVMATHTREQLDTALAAFEQVATALGLR
jgi:8-amino-7-oxononanoate synthase